ncbi:galactokinase [Paludibaculum fermentans]|uniref:Galactokinase n=1 Tax=Paludibaculum fermentans TaxID=1473598 RepID=A0A7S7NRA3_PALFE|nr:galactokinase [Paludibaculum fermentans]QOY88332.1 galactokinase [Paludibaculum fermentans]
MLSTLQSVEWTVDSRARARRITEQFRQEFGGEPALWARAPGRVDLMGSHTDYNLGFVLTLPISKDTWIAARPREDDLVRMRSMNLSAADEFHLGQIDRADDAKWRNYIRGVPAILRQEGLALKGCDAIVHSTVPLESGLSSSAALECALATVFEALGGWRLLPQRKAQLCQRAENEFAGVNCGILDQYSACLGLDGCALLLDCRNLSTRTVHIAENIHVVICNTMSRRRLSGGEYAQRRAECEQGAAILGVKALRDLAPGDLAAGRHQLSDTVARRCEFIVAESARVELLAQALSGDDRKAVAALCAGSFAGAKDLYEIVSPAMETMMACMLGAPGVLGARQAGAGFGGCMVALVDAAQTSAFRASVIDSYSRSTQKAPEIWPVTGARGAEAFHL